ncbi:MAG: DUF192 domain-containing protein [Candidatus Micrarchaeota archaeon]|nr:DUF192 domain-containing protein [Candidatus Micrarchaeota archaeon]
MKFDMGFALAVLVVLMAFVIFASSSLQPNYRLTNKANNKSVNISMEIADNDLSRMRGLMFRSKVIPILFVFGYTGLFPIHSHYCPGEFDAVYLSQDGKVVELFRKIPVGLDRIEPTKPASFLLELPPDVTDAIKIKVGDELSWKDLKK